DDLTQAHSPGHILESLVTEAVGYYEDRERNLGVDEDTGEPLLREIERRVMLSIIDQRWREHLYEMDYLQEGINLRAMGQQDPLVAWQSEGYEMFSQMMAAIEDDFVKYVMHMEVVVDQPESPQISNVQLSAPESPVQGQEAMREAAVMQAQEMGEAPEPGLQPEEYEVQRRNVKADVDLLDGLGRRVSDAEVLFELAREESDDSQAPELEQAVASLSKSLDELELRSLFTGEHDERDAVCEIHAGEGGTDAQDW